MLGERSPSVLELCIEHPADAPVVVADRADAPDDWVPGKRGERLGEGFRGLYDNDASDARRIEQRLQVRGLAIPVDRPHRGIERDVVASTQPPEMNVRIDGHAAGRCGSLPAMIIASTSSLVTSAVLATPTRRPFFITASRLARSKTSLISWLIRMMPMPCRDSSEMSAPTFCVSSGPSAAVGSSMMSTFALK